MNSKMLNRLLIQEFPILKEKYQEEISWQEGEDTGSHVVYGDVLTPYLVKCIHKNHISEIEKIFSFVEKLLSLQDSYTQEVITFSVLESILYLIDEIPKLQMYLGTMSVKTIKELK